MLGDGIWLAAQAAQQPFARSARVGHRFQRGERLGGDDEQRLGRIEIAHRFGEIRAVDVGDEAEGHGALAVVLQRFVGHDRPEVRSADADIDDIADPLAGVAFPGAAAHAIGEIGHPVRARRERRERRCRHRRRSKRRAAPAARHAAPRGFPMTLILSPRNMASMRSRSPDSSASCNSSFSVSSVMRFLE